MQYLYFQESGRLHVRTKVLDAELAKEFLNPIAVSDDYDIMTDSDEAAEEGMPNKREKTRSEIEADISYIDKRTAEYPSVVDQLDNIYHNGIDAWKTDIKAIKDKHPKGSE
tara:strand:- start:323 stop:655 length:333 start_codon:yes stop_codon:yes gene_type:complete